MSDSEKAVGQQRSAVADMLTKTDARDSSPSTAESVEKAKETDQSHKTVTGKDGDDAEGRGKESKGGIKDFFVSIETEPLVLLLSF